MDLPLPASHSPAGGSVPSRILVTGGAGFVGGSVVARLMLMGSQVGVVDDFSTGRIENLADAVYGGLSRNDILEGDVRTAEGVDIIRHWRPDVVVHLAAQSSLPAARQSPLFDADVNIFGTVNVLNACVESGVGLFVHAASSAVYGTVSPADLPVRETHPLAAASPYGISKAVGLCYLDWYRREHGLAFTSLAFSNVYGPRRAQGVCGVVSMMTDALLDDRPATIHGDGGQTRDFVHVSDVAEAVARACHHPGAGLVNIASGRQTSIDEVFHTVREAVGSDAEPCYEAMPDSAEVRHMALDIAKAYDVLGWRPTIGFTEGVQLTVREARRRRAGVYAPGRVQAQSQTVTTAGRR